MGETPWRRPRSASIFGLATAEAFEAVDRGELILAGCEMPATGPLPRWGCPQCRRHLG